MNLINLPLGDCAVTRKMCKDEAAPAPKVGKASNVILNVKKNLSEVPSLKIELKPGEMRKLGCAGAGNASSSTAKAEGLFNTLVGVLVGGCKHCKSCQVLLFSCCLL